VPVVNSPVGQILESQLGKAMRLEPSVSDAVCGRCVTRRRRTRSHVTRIRPTPDEGFLVPVRSGATRRAPAAMGLIAAILVVVSSFQTWLNIVFSTPSGPGTYASGDLFQLSSWSNSFWNQVAPLVLLVGALCFLFAGLMSLAPVRLERIGAALPYVVFIGVLLVTIGTLTVTQPVARAPFFLSSSRGLGFSLALVAAGLGLLSAISSYVMTRPSRSSSPVTLDPIHQPSQG